MGEQDPMIGRVLHGTIELRRRVGSGGMGHVYEGYQEHLDRVVAVKVLTPEHARNPIAAEYFLREARSASGLRHPNIIQIIDYGSEEDGTLFLAMEFVPGLPLGKVIKKEFPLTRDRVISILDQTLAGLGEAHRKQIVHRDLKPDNLMVETVDSRDFVKVLDFGIAQSKAPERKVGPLTRQGAVVGTPQYMSPEQATGDAVDARSDLFALGTILYEMLTQKCPFSGKNLPETLIAVIQHHPQPPSALRPDLAIDPKLEAVCLRAMKKEPDLRYQTADEFREALAQVLAEAAPSQQPAGAVPAQFIFRSRKGKRDSKPPTPAPQQPRVKTLEGLSEASEQQPPRTDQEGVSPPRTGKGRPAISDEELATDKTLAGPDTAREFGNRPSTSGKLGFDIAELRGDLLGERVKVVALVSHQRSRVRIDSEELLGMRRTLDNVHAGVAEHWRGQVHGRQGGFVTILFGVPDPGPDDALRAAQAALSLRRSLHREAPDGTAFSFAIAEGEVFCPDGKLSNAAGAPIDDATEAARAGGDANVLLVGDPLAESLDAVFRLDKLGADGHRSLLGVRDAGAIIEVRDEKRGELVGRDHEIATMLGLLGRLSHGNGAILPIFGEAGVGKSALAEEAARLADQRGFQVIRGRARWEGAELVRWVRVRWLIDILRQHGRSARDASTAFREMGVAPEYARVLGAFVDDRLDDAFGYKGEAKGADVESDAENAIRVAIRALLRILADSRPVVLVVDDVDGYQGAFAAMIASFGEFVEDVPVLIVVAARIAPGASIDELPKSTTPLYVQPLDDASARALLKVRLSGTATEQILQRLVRIGGGLPLHLEHLARHARSVGDVTEEETEKWLASSRDVNQLLRLRLFSQPKPLQNVLALLAALGDGTPGDALVDLASAEWEPEQAIESLYADGLISLDGDQENPRLYFRPPALGRVIYDQLSRKMTRRIHTRAATFYEERAAAAKGSPAHDDLVALARHRERAGDEQGALATLDTLIDRSLRRFEFEIARIHLEEASRIIAGMSTPDVERLAHYDLRLIRTAVATGRRTEALDRCLRLERSSNLKPETAAEVKVQLAELWLEDEDPDLVEKVARQALQQIRKLQNARPDDIALRCLLVRALQQLAATHEKAGRLVQAADFALEAAEIIERGEIEAGNNPYGPSIVWETLNQLGRIRIRAGELPGARKMFELAMRVVLQAEDARGEMAVRANIATLLGIDGQIDAAYQSLAAALRIARRLSDPRAVARLDYNRALLLIRQKRLEMAREALTASLALSDDLGWREGIAMNSERLRYLETVMKPKEDEFMRPGKR